MYRLFPTLLLFCGVVFAATPDFDIHRLPEDAIQPVVTTDSHGEMHLLYLTTVDKGQGVLTYQTPGTVGPRQISGVFRYGDAIARADMVVDADGRVHITWLDVGEGAIHYALGDRGSFSSRVIASDRPGVEAGAVLALAPDGVTITWHEGDMIDEASRYLVEVVAADGQVTTPRRVQTEPVGVCGCCGLAAGNMNREPVLAYRAATDNVNRDMQLISSGEQRTLSTWKLETCPVSTAEISAGNVVYESQRKIMIASLAAGAGRLVVDGSAVRQKHPAIAESADGSQLIVWSEANGYFSGGQLAIASRSGEGFDYRLTEHTIPDYSYPTVVVHEGRFLVIF